MSGRLNFAENFWLSLLFFGWQPVVTDGVSTSKKLDENGSIPRKASAQPTGDCQITALTKVELQQ